MLEKASKEAIDLTDKARPKKCAVLSLLIHCNRYYNLPTKARTANHIEFPFKHSVINEAARLSRSLKISEFTYWSSVFSIVLSRISHKTTCTIATPVVNRQNKYDRHSIGFFANTVLIRSSWEEGQSCENYLCNQQLKLTKDFCHQIVSVADIFSELKLNDKNLDGLTKVMFSLTQGKSENAIETGLNYEVKYDFNVHLSLNGKKNFIHFDYLASAYCQEQIKSFYSAMITVSEQLCKQPSLLMKDLILVENCEQATQPFIQEFVPNIILTQAKLTPENVALSVNHCLLTYGQLSLQSRNIAAQLQQLGVKKGDRIAIYMDRQLILPVVMLGILLTGAAYVPLDVSYPTERIKYILADSEPRLVIYNDQVIDEFDFIQWINVPNLQKESLKPFRHPEPLNENDLSHIIYTSGTTGKPKGVAICHKGVSSLYRWAASTYKSEDLSLVYGGTSICFDLSVFEIFITWSLGGQLHFAINALQLVDDLNKLPITLINTVPSVLKEVIQHARLNTSIRTINFAGETFPSSLAMSLFKMSESVRLFNLYGPSEDTTYSTFYEVTPNNCAQMMIGEPLPGTNAFVGDKNGRKIPNLFSGELYLSGQGLARGYWNLDQLTSEKFIEINSERYYTTGDIVRAQYDNLFEYIGRSDEQVKVHGYRIELAELDSYVLKYCRGVRQSSSVIIKNNQNKSLLAMAVISDGSIIETEISSILKSHLPNYMCPQFIKIVDTFPLMPSGKVDRKSVIDLLENTIEKESKIKKTLSNRIVI